MVAAYETIGPMIDAFAEGLTPMGFHHGSVMPFAGAVDRRTTASDSMPNR